MGHATVNSAYPLRQLLGDGLTNMFPVARIYDAVGALVTSVALPHLAEGMYGASWTPTVVGHYHAIYTVYTNVGLTVLSGYEKAGDEIEVTQTMPAAILDALLTDHVTPNSVGESFSLMLGLVQHNFKLDNPIYSTSGLMTSARIRIFRSAADTDAGVNPIATYAAVSVPGTGANIGRPASYKLTRTS